jgi:hypothetical protein
VTSQTTDTEATLTDPASPMLDDLGQIFDASADLSSLIDWNTLLSELDAPFLS